MHRFFRFPLLLAALVAVLATAGCGGANGAENASSTEAPARRSARVETLVLSPSTFEDIIDLTGTVQSDNDATLSAQTSGTLEYLSPLGRRVSAGAVVARLDQDLARATLQQFEAQLQNAQAQLELAEDNFQRQEPLYQDSIISALEFQNVRTQLNQARASLRSAQALRDQAQKQLDNTALKAPFAGLVESHFVEEGEQITPGQPVVRVVSTEHVKVNVGVPERYAGDIVLGTTVRISFQAYGAGTREGTVTFVGSAIDPDSRTFPIEIDLLNRDGTLKPEMIARVEVTRQRLDDVLVVPRSAVIRDENGISLFVVDRDDSVTARRRDVTLGPAYAGRVIVEDLKAGDEIVVLGQNTVTDGDALEVVEQYQRLDDAGVPVN